MHSCTRSTTACRATAPSFDPAAAGSCAACHAGRCICAYSAANEASHLVPFVAPCLALGLLRLAGEHTHALDLDAPDLVTCLARAVRELDATFDSGFRGDAPLGGFRGCGRHQCLAPNCDAISESVMTRLIVHRQRPCRFARRAT